VKRSREGTGTGTSSTPKPEDGSGSRSDINTQTRRSSNRPSNPSATPPGTERVDFKSTKDRMFTYARAGDSIRERRILAVHDRLEEQRRWGENGEEREGEEEEGEERQAEADYSREREGEDVEAGIGPEKISRLRGGGVGEEDLDTVRSEHYFFDPNPTLIGNRNFQALTIYFDLILRRSFLFRFRFRFRIELRPAAR